MPKPISGTEGEPAFYATKGFERTEAHQISIRCLASDRFATMVRCRTFSSSPEAASFPLPMQTRKQKKDFVLRARVTRQMKDAWNHLVIASGESEAFHLREAVREYLEQLSKKK